MQPRFSMGRFGIALLLVFGLFPFLFGAQLLRDWSAERPALVVFALFFFLCGLAMLISGVWSCLVLGHRRLPLWIGGGAMVLAAALLATVSLTDVLPCSSPV